MPIAISYNKDSNKISVEYRGEVREFDAHVYNGRATAYAVFASKFRSGNKLWPCRVDFWIESGKGCVQQGGFGNKGGATLIVGWWNAESKNNSQYKGKR